MLEELGEQCLRSELALKSVVGEAVPWIKYAWNFRYPGDLAEPSRDEAEQALGVARLVCNAVLGRLPGEVRA